MAEKLNTFKELQEKSHKAYLLFGVTGTHDDQHTWIVCGYSDKESAEKHQSCAQEEADRIFSLMKKNNDNYKYYDHSELPEKYANKFDDLMDIYDNATFYFIEETFIYPNFRMGV